MGITCVRGYSRENLSLVVMGGMSRHALSLLAIWVGRFADPNSRRLAIDSL